MHDLGYSHVLLDDDSGEPIGAVRDIDELPDGTPFGIIRPFGTNEPETYVWLDGLDVLRLADAAPHVRKHVAWALKQLQIALRSRDARAARRNQAIRRGALPGCMRSRFWMGCKVSTRCCVAGPRATSRRSAV
jgi:hypothetical protein